MEKQPTKEELEAARRQARADAEKRVARVYEEALDTLRRGRESTTGSDPIVEKGQ